MTLIDVRTLRHAEGHIPGAHVIPVPQLGDRLAEVPTDREVHVVCRSGRRSTQGAELLDRHGIDAVPVDGGW